MQGAGGMADAGRGVLVAALRQRRQENQERDDREGDAQWTGDSRQAGIADADGRSLEKQGDGRRAADDSGGSRASGVPECGVESIEVTSEIRLAFAPKR